MGNYTPLEGRNSQCSLLHVMQAFEGMSQHPIRLLAYVYSPYQQIFSLLNLPYRQERTRANQRLLAIRTANELAGRRGSCCLQYKSHRYWWPSISKGRLS